MDWSLHQVWTFLSFPTVLCCSLPVKTLKNTSSGKRQFTSVYNQAQWSWFLPHDMFGPTWKACLHCTALNSPFPCVQCSLVLNSICISLQCKEDTLIAHFLFGWCFHFKSVRMNSSSTQLSEQLSSLRHFTKSLMEGFNVTKMSLLSNYALR